jgi:hypothetical protein
MCILSCILYPPHPHLLGGQGFSCRRSSHSQTAAQLKFVSPVVLLDVVGVLALPSLVSLAIPPLRACLSERVRPSSEDGVASSRAPSHTTAAAAPCHCNDKDTRNRKQTLQRPSLLHPLAHLAGTAEASPSTVDEPPKLRWLCVSGASQKRTNKANLTRLPAS